MNFSLYVRINGELWIVPLRSCLFPLSCDFLNARSKSIPQLFIFAIQIVNNSTCLFRIKFQNENYKSELFEKHTLFSDFLDRISFFFHHIPLKFYFDRNWKSLHDICSVLRHLHSFQISFHYQTIMDIAKKWGTIKIDLAKRPKRPFWLSRYFLRLPIVWLMVRYLPSNNFRIVKMQCDFFLHHDSTDPFVIFFYSYESSFPKNVFESLFSVRIRTKSALEVRLLLLEMCSWIVI